MDSCIEGVNEMLGGRFSRAQVVSAVLQHDFNVEAAVHQLLEGQPAEQQQSTVGKVEKGKGLLYENG